MRRVLIVGAPGTGKTTFARKLAEQTDLPLIHLDLYYHDKTKDYYEGRDKEAWYAKVNDLIATDKWIIDGNYNSTLETRVKRADTIVFFDFKRHQALKGIFNRYFELRDKERNDMPSDWKEHIEWGFVRYVWRYNKDKRPRVKSIIESPKNKTLLVFHNYRQADDFIRNQGLTK